MALTMENRRFFCWEALGFMRFGLVKVAVGTPEIRVADCGYNAKAIIGVMERAAGDGVQLLTLPELCLTGYT